MAATDRHVASYLVASIALALLPQLAAAQSRGVSKLGVYSDDDATLVISPMIGVSTSPIDDATLRASYIADMVTTSSVDLVSAATGRFEERRDVIDASADYTTSGYLSFGAGYQRSEERDYTSDTVSAHLGQELFNRNLVTTAAYSLSLNDVGRSGDPSFSESMTNHSLTLSAAQVLGRDTVGRLTWQGQRAQGFQASVYRFVPIGRGGRSGGRAFQMPERVPDRRDRHAIALGINHRLRGPWYGQVDYRFYRDSWDLTGHTTELRLLYEISRTLYLRLRERVHLQSSAGFYQRRYDQPMAYMTTDKELTELWSSTTGLKIDYTWRAGGRALGVDSIGANAKVDWLHIEYGDFERLGQLSAWVGEVGTSLTF